MLPFYSTTLAVLIALVSLSGVNATPYGCFSLVGDASIQLTYNFMSSGKCIDACPNSPFVAVQNEACYCLSLLPSGQLSDSQCLLTCPGWPQDTCGSSTAYTVYTGTGKYVPSSSSSSSSSNSASGLSSLLALTRLLALALLRSAALDSLLPTQPASTSESLQTPTSSRSTATVVTTVSSLPSLSGSVPSGSKDAKTLNAGAIAGGVVGGVAGLGLVAAALFFWWRRRRSQHDHYDLEEEAYFDKPGGALAGVGAIAPSPSFTRNSSRNKAKPSPMDMPLSNPFVHPADRAAAGGAPDLADPRMNPAMMGRQRISTGLLADEADYSRKILQVVNPEP